MGKTYRRDKNVWDDDPVRFENRGGKSRKKMIKQNPKFIKKVNKVERCYDEIEDEGVHNRER
jgi:hypothetical protein